jgi:amino acid adenylation domain-containing protein
MTVHRRYWQAHLGGELPVLELPGDRPRPPRRSFRGRELSFTLAAERLQALQAFCHARNASLFMGLHALLKVLLFRHTGQDDIIVGCAVAGRDHPDLGGQIGFYLNTLALRTAVDAEAPFERFFAEVAQTTREAFDHQSYPFDQLVGELDLPRDPSRFPLFDVMLVLQSQDEPGLQFDGVCARPVFEHPETSKFDLTFCFKALPQGLILGLEYNTDLYDAPRMERMGRQFLRLVDSVLADPCVALGRLELLPEDERRRLASFNPRQPACGALPGVVECFEQQAARAPDRIALVWPGDAQAGNPALRERAELSYGELNCRANRLARRLLRLGIGRGERVGLYLERSPDVVVGVLGVLKAGAAYVPLDIGHPQARIAAVLADAAPAALVSRRRLAEGLQSAPGQLVVLDEIDSDAAGPCADLPLQAGARDLAYVIYTSGSTGQPKGVMVEHGNLSRLFAATGPWFGFGANDIGTLFHSHAFDFSVWEMWAALMYGGRLVVPSYWTTRSPQAFRKLLAAERVTVLNQTPSAFRLLVEHEQASGPLPELALRVVIFGGEALDFRSLAPWFERHGDETPRLVNMYGITETTVHVTYRPITAADVGEPASVIGQPIPDLRIHLLDARQQQVPIGVPGEICVGGAGVARGYLNRPDLTVQRFLADPLADSSGGTLYRSGDLGRYRENGDIEYLGRIDRQVQIRGHRVEPAEVEAALAAHPGVAQALVDVRCDAEGRAQLVAWYSITGERESAPIELRAALRRRLPDYMVPASLVRVERFELTPNGKVDRRRLPEPEGESMPHAIHAPFEAKPAALVDPATAAELEMLNR